MITGFKEAYSQYDIDGCPTVVDISISFVDRTKEEGDLVEKFRQLQIAQMKAQVKANRRGSSND